jgi:hypothetical protein
MDVGEPCVESLDVQGAVTCWLAPRIEAHALLLLRLQSVQEHSQSLVAVLLLAALRAACRRLLWNQTLIQCLCLDVRYRLVLYSEHLAERQKLNTLTMVLRKQLCNAAILEPPTTGGALKRWRCT